MAQRLADLITWTRFSNTAQWSALGFGVINDSPANTRNGDDSILITGSLEGSEEPALQNNRSLKFGTGNNLISIQLNADTTSGGDALLNSIGASIKSSGNLTIDIRDTVGQAADFRNGIVNYGSIGVSGNNALTITVRSQSKYSLINGGVNNSAIPLASRVTGGSQADAIDVNGIIDNLTGSTINLFAGDDALVAKGLYGHGDITLKTMARDILTGVGRDSIDVSAGLLFDTGGLSNVCIDLGADDDVIRAFGTARLYGGKGLDTLLLPIGDYQVLTTAVKGCFQISDGTTNLYVSGFEQVGNFAGTLSDFPIGSGIGVLSLT
ncbi:MAG: hypothetical protein ACKO2F_00065 [Cyanobacteriota bacterium]